MEEYKKQLESKRDAILAEIKKEGVHEDFGSDVDMDEETDEAESFGEKVAIGQNHRERIAEIESALKKINEGGYGVCEKCGGKIEEEVLGASPESKFCKNCKKGG